MNERGSVRAGNVDPLAKDGATLPTEQLLPGQLVAVGEMDDFEIQPTLFQPL
jgi:hypothetical protein